MKPALPLATCLALALQIASVQSEVYQTPEKFLSESFAGAAPAPEIVWITGDLAARVKALLGHQPSALRLRYWAQGARTAWILNEIGKTEAITAGILIEDQKIARIQILEFRESRGWEVRHDFFTNQFIGLGLQEDDRLTGQVDGISGATMSVRAVSDMAKLALLLARHVALAKTP
jgi:FMN-binding domain